MSEQILNGSRAAKKKGMINPQKNYKTSDQHKFSQLEFVSKQTITGNASVQDDITRTVNNAWPRNISYTICASQKD